ncbi:MAG: retroviral-like aspartic protease family protein [Paraglaciecola sp.]|nr:retroviral-like aspartic protease family protein [Paraglaciecola sp.]
MTWHRILVVSLAVSLLVNFAFILQLLQTATTSTQQVQTPNSDKAPFSEKAKSELHALPLNNADSQQTTHAPSHQPASPNFHATSVPERSELLAKAQQWLRDENYPALELFLRDYLQQYPLDMDFLLLEADLIVQTNLTSDAIAHFYSLKKQPMSDEQNQLIDERIRTLSEQTILQLQKAHSWDTLAIFVEPLLQLEPENRLYLLALAEAYAQQQQINLMENILAALDYNDPNAMRIRQLTFIAHDNGQANKNDEIPEIDTDIPSSSAIELMQLGDQYVVNAHLSGNQVALLVDTGASITSISQDYFQGLSHRFKVNYVGRFNVNTAAGRVSAPMYQFAELRLNHVSVSNISVMVIPMETTANINGLLGMNFLREFDFKIDQRQARLLLVP